MKTKKLTGKALAKMLKASTHVATIPYDEFNFQKLKEAKAKIDAIAPPAPDYLVEWKGEMIQYANVPPNLISYPKGSWIISPPCERAIFKDFKIDRDTKFFAANPELPPGHLTMFTTTDEEREELILKLAPYAVTTAR